MLGVVVSLLLSIAISDTLSGRIARFVSQRLSTWQRWPQISRPQYMDVRRWFPPKLRSEMWRRMGSWIVSMVRCQRFDWNWGSINQSCQFLTHLNRMWRYGSGVPWFSPNCYFCASILQHHPNVGYLFCRLTSFLKWEADITSGSLWDLKAKTLGRPMGDMSKSMTRVRWATKLLLTLQLRSLHSEKCIHVFADMCIEYIFQTYTYGSILYWWCMHVHVPYTHTYTHIPNHFILMKCLRILICQKKKVSVYFIMYIYIISNMFQLHRQFVHALLAHGTAVGRLCLAESHLAPLVSAWGGVEIPTARMEALVTRW